MPTGKLFVGSRVPGVHHDQRGIFRFDLDVRSFPAAIAFAGNVAGVVGVELLDSSGHAWCELRIENLLKRGWSGARFDANLAAVYHIYEEMITVKQRHSNERITVRCQNENIAFLSIPQDGS
jgi:hypothetical protein